MENSYASNPKEGAQQIKCSNCGAHLQFFPGTQSLKCHYCQTEQELPRITLPIEELDFNEYLEKLAAKEKHANVKIVKCEACGSQTQFDPNIVSDLCCFCGSPLQVQNAASCEIIQPKSLIPFQVDRQTAFKQFQSWLTGLWFAPSILKKQMTHPEKFSGVYIPYWTYDTDTLSHYTGQRGEAYYTTETYTTFENGRSVTRTRTVRRIRWYPASGKVFQHFDDILVIASQSLPKKYAEKLEPWHLEGLIPFDEKFLSGFRAESYQLGLEPGFAEALDKMEVTIRDLVRQDIGGDEQVISSLHIQPSAMSFKHILLPIWLNSFRYQGKSYRFLINGVTGEVQGERPYSFWKIFFASVLGLILIIIIAMIFLAN